MSEYRKPKDDEELDDATKKLREEGCAPKTPPTSDKEDEEELVLPVKGMVVNKFCFGLMWKARPRYVPYVLKYNLIVL